MRSAFAMMLVVLVASTTSWAQGVTSDAPIVHTARPQAARAALIPDDQPMPPGARRVWRPLIPLLAVGGATFVVTWAATAAWTLVALVFSGVSCSFGNCGTSPAWAFIPVVGPFLAAPTSGLSALSTTLQAVGLSVAAAGLIFGQHFWAPGKSVEVGPGALTVRF